MRMRLAELSGALKLSGRHTMKIDHVKRAAEFCAVWPQEFEV
jgi:hypothetical protein